MINVGIVTASTEYESHIERFYQNLIGRCLVATGTRTYSYIGAIDLQIKAHWA